MGLARAFLEELQMVVQERERRHHHSECSYTERQIEAKKEKWPQCKKHSLAKYGNPVT